MHSMHCPVINGFAVTVYSSTLVRMNQKSEIRSEWSQWVQTLIQRSIPLPQKISVVPPRVDTTYLYQIYFSGTGRSQYHLSLSDILVARTNIYSAFNSHMQMQKSIQVQNHNISDYNHHFIWYQCQVSFDHAVQNPYHLYDSHQFIWVTIHSIQLIFKSDISIIYIFTYLIRITDIKFHISFI